jgi:hypothetical protein
MNFDAGRWAAKITRMSERRSIDSLDVDKVIDVAGELRGLVGRWGVWEQTILKIARAVVERQLSPAKVGELIEATLVRTRLPGDKRLRNPGAYFVCGVINALAERGHDWKALNDAE